MKKPAVCFLLLAALALSGCGQGKASTAGPSPSASVADEGSGGEGIADPAPTASEQAVSADPADADRPAGALDLGESVVLDGISITVSEFRAVTPVTPLSCCRFVAAKMSFTNTTDGPKSVIPDAQVTLENLYVATIAAQAAKIKDGSPVPWGTFRPGTTVSGWVVWGTYEKSLAGFGIYYVDETGNKAIWWPRAK